MPENFIVIGESQKLNQEAMQAYKPEQAYDSH